MIICVPSEKVRVGVYRVKKRCIDESCLTQHELSMLVPYNQIPPEPSHPDAQLMISTFTNDVYWEIRSDEE